jgi:hypothetical protein
MATVLQTQTELVTAGLPTGANLTQAIQSSLGGGTQVQGVYNQLWQMTNMFESAAAGVMTWNASTTTGKVEVPVLFLLAGIGTNSNSVLLSMLQLTDVTTGQEAPEEFTGSDGQQYNRVAYVELQIKLGVDLTYVAVFQTGVPTTVSPSTYGSVDWTQTLDPVLGAIATSINSVFTPTPQGEAPRSEVAGASLGVVGAVVSKAVPFALLAIKIYSAVTSIIEHTSSLQELIFNFSNTPLQVPSYWNYQQGMYSVTSTTGQDLSSAPSFSIPGIQTYSHGDKSISLVQFASVALRGASDLKGTGTSFQITQSDGGNATALYSVPFSGDNHLAATADYSGTPEEFWDANSGKTPGLGVSISLSNGRTLTLGIDALSGKQPGFDGGEAYSYHALTAIS